MFEKESTFEKELQTFTSLFQKLIPKLYPHEDRLHQASRYALESGGKRVRPLLVLLVHKIFSERYTDALPAALSVEILHTYSLVHDDLPLMDNDDLRRGRATVHKVYDDATALLVGDALLSDAFFCLSGGVCNFFPELEIPKNSEKNLEMLRELSQAVGGCGMVYGQALDIAWTGRKNYTLEDLHRIHTHKTGKLFAACCALGAIAGGASEREVSHLRHLGERFGLAYQIMDDAIDDLKGTGKSTGKDRSAGKLTYLSFMNADQARQKAETLMQEICMELERDYGAKASCLQMYLKSLVHRKF